MDGSYGKQEKARANGTEDVSIPMADENDAKHLTESLAFLRRQLEYFQASAKDVEVRKGKGGKYRTVRVGQIGIRCIHCAHRPAEERATGAVAFPTSTGLVYQAVRNWQRKSMQQVQICLKYYPFSCHASNLWPRIRSVSLTYPLLHIIFVRVASNKMCTWCLYLRFRISLSEMPRHSRGNKGEAQIVQAVALRPGH